MNIFHPSADHNSKFLLNNRPFNTTAASDKAPLKRAYAPSPAAAGSKAFNVLLITFDSLSASDMSLYGYHRNTTPNLDDFSRECYVFDYMYANCNSSVPSVFSILTGKYPTTHNLFASKYPITDSYKHISSVLVNRKKHEHIGTFLKTKGYQTMAIVALEKFYFWLGGFKNFYWPKFGPVMSQPFKNRNRLKTRTVESLALTFRKAEDFLKTAMSPFFLWIHTYPPHEPYLPSEQFKNIFSTEKSFDTLTSQRPYFYRRYPENFQPEIDKLRNRYNEQILDVDYQFGKFLKAVEQKGCLNNTLIIITADHGEMFEKGYQGHGSFYLYNPLLHIPLIIRLPQKPGGKRIMANAEQADIAPTILDILGFKVPLWMEGVSLKGAMEGKTSDSKPKFAMSRILKKNGRFSEGSIAVVQNRHKLIYHIASNVSELYNLSADPGEKKNIVNNEKTKVKQFKKLIFDTVLKTPG